jgi:hypothetical protein
LVFIRTSGISDRRKEELITAFFLACLYSGDSPSIEHDAIDRYKRELEKQGAAWAREAKKATSQQVDEIISRHAQQLRTNGSFYWIGNI